MRVLNVAEKNSASKTIATLLSNGGHRTRDGFSVYNKIYEFQHTLLGEPSQMIVTSVSGHLLNLEFTPEYRTWGMCDPIELFDAPVKKLCLPDFQNIKKTLEREAGNSDALVIWTDCDREGENIGHEVFTVCKAVHPNIRVYRAKFSDFTLPSIVRACQRLEHLDEKMSSAVDVRMELDLRIGAAFTRLQTTRYQSRFPGHLSGHLISYGSCQFPTLGFVVERHRKIDEFVAEQFWKLSVLHRVDERQATFAWMRRQLFSLPKCTVLLEMCQTDPTAAVLSVNNRPTSKWRPQALDTVEFEKNCSRKLRINAKEAMNVAERLYTQGFISYPRTETNKFPKDIDLVPLVEMQAASGQWGEFAARVLRDGPNPRNGCKTDNAHPPIYPTKFTNSLRGNDGRIYEYIVRHFLACLSKDAKGSSTTVAIKISGEVFSANGLTIVEKNYLDVYIYETWSDKVIPTYTVGETFIPTSIRMLEGATEPPKLLTEADLITLMEKHGIGTDATHAEHIETIKSREYVSIENDRFMPTLLGFSLVKGYDSMGFEMSKPKLRASLEDDLKQIIIGAKRPADVLKAQVQIYKRLFIEARTQIHKMDKEFADCFR